MDLLDRLAGSIFDSSADGMVEDEDFFDSCELLTEQMLYFAVVVVPDDGIVDKELLFGGLVINFESRVVGSELMLTATKIMDLARVRIQLKVGARPINFGPRLACVGTCVDVDEICCSHDGFL